MNKILWIMTNSVNNCIKLQNKYAINLLNDEKIIGYGSIEASNYDEFFNTDSCFWMIVSDEYDVVSTLKDFSIKSHSPIIARLNSQFFCFNENGEKIDDNNWTIIEAKKILETNWDLDSFVNSNKSQNDTSNSNDEFEKRIDEIFVPENNFSGIITENDDKNNELSINEFKIDGESFDSSIGENFCAKCLSKDCTCENNNIDLSKIFENNIVENDLPSKSFNSIEDEIFEMNKSFENKNDSKITISSDLEPISLNSLLDNYEINEGLNNDFQENLNSSKNEKPIFDFDSQEDFEFEDEFQSHHFDCVCSDKDDLEQFKVEQKPDLESISDKCKCDPCKCDPCKCDPCECDNKFDNEALNNKNNIHWTSDDINFINENKNIFENEDNQPNFKTINSENFDSFDNEFVSTSDNYENNQLPDKDKQNRFVEIVEINNGDETSEMYELEDSDIINIDIVNSSQINNELYTYEKNKDIYEYESPIYSYEGTKENIIISNNLENATEESVFLENEKQTINLPNVTINLISENIDSTFDEEINEEINLLQDDKFDIYEETHINVSDHNHFEECIIPTDVVNDEKKEEYVDFDDYIVGEQEIDINRFKTEIESENNTNNEEEIYEPEISVEPFNLSQEEDKEIYHEKDGKYISRDIKEFLLELQREKERLRKKREEIQKRSKRARMIILEHLNFENSEF